MYKVNILYNINKHCRDRELGTDSIETENRRPKSHSVVICGGQRVKW